MRDDERHEEHDDMNDDMNGDVRENETNDDAHGAGEGSDVMFDSWLPNAARDYNRPPASVPRAEMWAQISASLSSSHRTPAMVTPILTHAASRRTLRPWQMAAAAALLLGTGIAIGQRFSTPDREASSVAASTPAVTPAVTQSGSNVPGGTSPAGQTASDSRRTSSDARNQPALGPRGADAHYDASYSLATVDHFARAEALLTSFKGERNDSVDVSMERWAQDLLADTRLLLDSPAATDSRRRRLLEDLELVLAQIVQLRAESSADRSLVRKSIERGEVLTRIRSTIPAGSASGV